MIKKISFISFLFCFICVSLFFVHSQIITTEILTDNYKIVLNWDESNFFTGNLKVVTRLDDKIIFSADSIFKSYNWDTLIDLNNDGTKELILDLGTGATMYDYNMFLIFDFTKSAEPLFEIHNADLITNVDVVPKIVSNVRLSPSYLGACFSYSLRYDDGNLIFEDNASESKVLKNLEPHDKYELELINNFKKEVDECDESSSFIIYFEAYITQQKILNQEDKGWKFFDKYYNCKDKKKVRELLSKDVNFDYNEWKFWNYRFNKI